MLFTEVYKLYACAFPKCTLHVDGCVICYLATVVGNVLLKLANVKWPNSYSWSSGSDYGFWFLAPRKHCCNTTSILSISLFSDAWVCEPLSSFNPVWHDTVNCWSNESICLPSWWPVPSYLLPDVPIRPWWCDLSVPCGDHRGCCAPPYHVHW